MQRRSITRVHHGKTQNKKTLSISSHYQINTATMPILNFNNTKAAAYQQQLIDITRNRSTESTVDATGGGGGPKPQGFPDHDEPVEVSLTPPTSPSHKQAHHHPLGS